MKSRFDLTKALATWRQFQVRRHRFLEEDLDELEVHLRAHMSDLRKQGWSEEAAFREGVRVLGDMEETEAEYSKVYWSKLKHRHKLTDEFRWRGSMLKNYIKVAFRTLRRQKGYSFLNIAGLSIGLASAFLIILWIQDEVSYDRFHEDGDRIYRVMRHVHTGDQIQTSERITWNIAHVLKEEYPEVEDVVLMTEEEDLVFRVNDFSASESGRYAGPAFFNMFSWELIQGNPDEILENPTSVVISATLAQKYFGSNWREHNGAIGKTIHIDNRADFIVTGVFKDIPHNSSLRFDFVLPMEEYESRNGWLKNWDNSGPHLFVRTHTGIDGPGLSDKITNIQNNHIEGFRSDLFLHPYSDQYLYSTFKEGQLNGGRIEYVRVFGVIALMIVLIACINFLNLSTARSMRRAREIGVRKAIGAERNSLIQQFMGETLLLVGMAFVIAMGLVMATLPLLNTLTGKEVAIIRLLDSSLLFVGIGIATAMIAGTYPALYLSSFNAVRILRGTFRLSGGNAQLRKGLVVFQFAMSILLIVGTVTVSQQISYIHSKNLGLDRENVIYLPLEDIGERFDTAKEELLQLPGIASVTSSNSSPLNVGSNTHQVSWRGRDPNSSISMNILTVNFDFLDVMKMELIEGRDFDSSFGTDSVNYIINERALEVMGFENPMSEQLRFWGDTGAIVGVVKDFHMTSLYTEIKPTIIRLRPQNTWVLFVRTKAGQTQEALESLEEVYSRFNPDYPFEYQFLDDSFRQTYSSEIVIGKLASYFTAFALFIACLGLFGLTSFTAQQRTKEIGIRKVLGATVSNLTVLLSKDFITLVLIACFIAAPVSYFLMENWLANNFAYHIELGIGIFAVAGAVALLIALGTISYQAIKTALANPIKSLRYE